MKQFSKNSIFIILLLCISFGFISLQSNSQFFEGEIIYTNTYKSKSPKLKDQQLSSMLGPTHYYYIKGGNYKTLTNGMFAQWQLYKYKENRIYNKMTYTDTVFYLNAAEHDDEVLNFKITKNATVILGYKCDELILTCRSGVHKYYYNSTLRVNSNLYLNHAFANYYAYLSKTNAVPLKSIIEDAEFTMTSVATEIKPKKLEDSFFDLPADSKLAKSIY